jgi:hypothetical protein
LWFAISALAATGAALALPGPTGAPTAIASVLAVGALALLAGHTWGLLVITIADIALLAHVWPLLAFGASGPPLDHLAAAAALVTALPALAFLGVALPALVDTILDAPSARMRSAAVTACAIGAAVTLILPAL